MSAARSGNTRTASAQLASIASGTDVPRLVVGSSRPRQPPETIAESSGSIFMASRSAIVISPLLGGGLVTATVPLLLQGFGLLPILAGTTALAVILYLWPMPRTA